MFTSARTARAAENSALVVRCFLSIVTLLSAAMLKNILLSQFCSIFRPTRRWQVLSAWHFDIAVEQAEGTDTNATVPQATLLAVPVVCGVRLSVQVRVFSLTGLFVILRYYYMPLILSTCYNHFIPIVGVGKERRTLIGPW